MKNETLGSLGNIEENMYLGVRLREEIRQVLSINNSGDDRRGALIKDKKEEAKKEEGAPKKKKVPKSSEPSLLLSSKSSSEDLIGNRTLRKRKFTLTSVEEQDEKSEEVNDAQSEGRQSSGTIRKNLASNVKQA
jgi:hypothetical protein